MTIAAQPAWARTCSTTKSCTAFETLPEVGDATQYIFFKGEGAVTALDTNGARYLLRAAASRSGRTVLWSENKSKRFPPVCITKTSGWICHSNSSSFGTG